MPVELFRIVTDFVPRGFFCDELVESILQTELTVEGIGRNGKAICVRKDFSKRRAAGYAKATAILVRRNRLKKLDVLSAMNPFQVFFLNEHNSTRANLAAPRAVTCPHHGWFSQ